MTTPRAFPLQPTPDSSCPPPRMTSWMTCAPLCPTRPPLERGTRTGPTRPERYLVTTGRLLAGHLHWREAEAAINA